MNDTIRVLYAEDNAQDADLTKTYFELNAPEFQIEVMSTGQQCLDRLERETPDVLLLDNHLPDMDGIDVLKEFSARDLSMPVVMVTALGDEALVVQVIRLGAWDYVPKQGNYIETLPAVLKSAVTEYRQQQQSHSLGARRRSRRILYVEDNTADIDLTLAYFRDVAAPFNLEVVRSCREALVLLGESDFDLVLADLRMPDMTALDLLVKAKHTGIAVPFVVITGKGDEAAAVTALKLGAYDYIVKRDGYLTQLPYAMENAISRADLLTINRRLQIELSARERAESEREKAALAKAQLNQRAQELQAANRELQTTNAEMEAFAYSASHDLHAPLRHICSFVELLSQRLRPAMDAEAERYTTVILQACSKMRRLIDDLLSFARMDRAELRKTTVNLDVIVQQIISEMKDAVGERRIEWTVHNLPTVQSDAAMIHIVLTNYISNAIKYTQNKNEAHLEIGALRSDSEVIIYVRDDGAGFDMNHIGKLFHPFQRLHPSREFEGTGVGLATVRRIIDRHGGNTWAEGIPNKGATFFFSLPDQNPPALLDRNRDERIG